MSLVLATFFIEDSYAGRGLIPDEEFHRRPMHFRQHSRAFFCLKCGRLWARIIYEDSRGWTVSHRGCRKCGYQGSIMADTYWQALDHLPLPVLEWELFTNPDLPEFV